MTLTPRPVRLLPRLTATVLAAPPTPHPPVPMMTRPAPTTAPQMAAATTAPTMAAATTDPTIAAAGAARAATIPPSPCRGPLGTIRGRAWCRPGLCPSAHPAPAFWDHGRRSSHNKRWRPRTFLLLHRAPTTTPRRRLSSLTITLRPTTSTTCVVRALHRARNIPGLRSIEG